MPESTDIKIGDSQIDDTSTADVSNGTVTYTQDEIKSYLNNDFMSGSMSAAEFLDIMLVAAVDEETEQTALRALTIALGDLRFSSMTASNSTFVKIQEGPENEKTQSLVAALTPEHLAKMRALITKTQSAEDPYLLALKMAPKNASSEDIHLLLQQLRGEESLLTEAIDKSRPWYYPKKVQDEIETLDGVISARPELVDEPTVQISIILPELIRSSYMVPRRAYDSGVSIETIMEAASNLQRNVNLHTIPKLS